MLKLRGVLLETGNFFLMCIFLVTLTCDACFF